MSIILKLPVALCVYLLFLQLVWYCGIIFPKQGKWTNKERVLIFSSRGINFRTRHLMQDLRTMMPHSKAGQCWGIQSCLMMVTPECMMSQDLLPQCSVPDTKMDRKDKLFVVNEVSLWRAEFLSSHSIAWCLCAFQVCEIKNCNKCLFFEAKKKQDLYMWWGFLSNV